MACEPQTIEGLLADPLIQSLMRADRVDAQDLKSMLTGLAAQRRARGLDLKGARVWFCGQRVAPPPAPVTLRLTTDVERVCR